MAGRLDGRSFGWSRARPDETAQAELVRAPWRELPDGLLAVLPDGFTVEVSPRARQWWGEAAVRLAHGSL